MRSVVCQYEKWAIRWLLTALCIHIGCSPSQPSHDQSSPSPAPQLTEPSVVVPESSQAAARLPFPRSQSLSIRPIQPGDVFEDVAFSTGLQFHYEDGSPAGCYELLESVGGGVLILDADQDGSPDVFFPGGGRLQPGMPPKVFGRSGALFRQTESLVFKDVTDKAGVLDDTLYTHGGTVTDFDSDGFDDLLVAGYGGLRCWRNQGDGTFEEVAQQLGLISPLWNVSLAAGDFTQDGLVDIYCLTYADWSPDADRTCLNDRQSRDICGPTLFNGVSDRVFMNTGAGFDGSRHPDWLVKDNRGLGVVVTDIDGNGMIDIAVVNDVQENQLYMFEEAGTEDAALLAGMAYSSTGEREGSMGIDVSDFNNDGFPDIWYTNYAQQDNSLLKQTSPSRFLHISDVTGMAGVSRPWVGFGTGFVDVNMDGFDDLIVLNGHVAYERRDSPYFQPPQLFRNINGERFEEISGEGGPYFECDRSARGLAKVDLDSDGAMDIITVHQNDPVAVLKNRLSPVPWIRIQLIGKSHERRAVGAVVTVSQANRRISRWVVSGGSYLSQSDQRLLFHLSESGTETPEVEVRWPGGKVESFGKKSLYALHRLVEGRGN